MADLAAAHIHALTEVMVGHQQDAIARGRPAEANRWGWALIGLAGVVRAMRSGQWQNPPATDRFEVRMCWGHWDQLGTWHHNPRVPLSAAEQWAQNVSNGYGEPGGAPASPVNQADEE